MKQIPVHPFAAYRPGDKRFVVTLMEVPTRADIALGLASSDHNAWPKTKYVAYGTNKTNATRRAEGGES